MEVKFGYKLTEVGIVPEDWGVHPLGSLTNLLTNGFVGTATNAYVDGEDGVLYIQGYNVLENGFNFHGIKRVATSFHYRNQKSCLQAGDLLTIQTGDIGVTAVVPPKLAGSNCHALIISRLRKSASDPYYYSQYFNSERGRSAFKKIETGTTMKHLNCGDMKDLLLPSPSLSEQRAIAAALSDVDALLDGLNRLIAKKRDLKQAAIQQLLTGQIRLSKSKANSKYKRTEVGVIPEDWDVQPLSSLTNHPIQNGVFNEPARKGRGFKLINVGDLYAAVPIDLRSLELFDASKYELSRFGVSHGDIFFTRSSLTPDGIAHCNIYEKRQDEAVVFDCHIIRVQPNPKKVDPFFLFRYCTAFSARKYLVANSQTTTMTTIGQSVIANLPIALPPLLEQHAIANVLSDMDAEIVALERRRDKTRNLKQGMMQELLTGRIRLV
jgi:type I restriction enzyme, S subunit